MYHQYYFETIQVQVDVIMGTFQIRGSLVVLSSLISLISIYITHVL